jgi:hypothetical protein
MLRTTRGRLRRIRERRSLPFGTRSLARTNREGVRATAESLVKLSAEHPKAPVFEFVRGKFRDCCLAHGLTLNVRSVTAKDDVTDWRSGASWR